MSELSRFYGIIIRLIAYDTGRHNEPHIHAKAAEHTASIRIPDGTVLAGNLPSREMKLVQAWIELHTDELMTAWELASSGFRPDKIAPLQ